LATSLIDAKDLGLAVLVVGSIVVVRARGTVVVEEGIQTSSVHQYVLGRQDAESPSIIACNILSSTIDAEIRIVSGSHRAEWCGGSWGGLVVSRGYKLDKVDIGDRGDTHGVSVWMKPIKIFCVFVN
jgi:hypothetical protein